MSTVVDGLLIKPFEKEVTFDKIIPKEISY